MHSLRQAQGRKPAPRPMLSEAAQEIDDAAKPAFGQGRLIEGIGHALGQLRQRGIRQHGPVKSPILMSWRAAITQSWSSSPASAPTMVQPRIRPVRPGDDLDEAVGGRLGLGTVVVGIGPAQDADAAVFGARLGFGEADLGELGIGIGDARDGAGARPCGRKRNSAFLITMPA